MPIPKLIIPVRHGDERGWFTETYHRERLRAEGITAEFVQDNHSYSALQGTLRGIHFQTAPHAQAKLVRCLAGAIWDVAVDLRSGSPSFGHWLGVKLTASGGEQLYVPEGFGHGFLTLTADVEIAYKVTDHYAPECDAGIAWNDPDVAVAWPLNGRSPILSGKDRELPHLRTLAPVFAYDGVPMVDLGQP